ncbi:uncharacterized protein LOC116265875 isoform X2 [Nymphaea colorata]|nr:uncharacterized protein LOC116265875 isoform X2 [Nymphaea colorata]XP_049936746.1 uncharacterized protein LOC116265875 isoform X2 [Nymphaea colorata]
MSKLPEGTRGEPSQNDVPHKLWGQKNTDERIHMGWESNHLEIFGAVPSRTKLMVQNVILRGEVEDLHNKDGMEWSGFMRDQTSNSKYNLDVG